MHASHSEWTEDQLVRSNMAAQMPSFQHGLIAGTHVASSLGWRLIETIAPGDRVLTFDNKMQTVVDVQVVTNGAADHSAPESQWPVQIPAGVFGNRRDLRLVPDQCVLIESEAVADPLGDPFATVPVSSLVGVRGIRRVPLTAPLETVCLFFEKDQVIYVEGGLLGYCPRAFCYLTELLDADLNPYKVLDQPEALKVARALQAPDHAPASNFTPNLSSDVA